MRLVIISVKVAIIWGSGIALGELMCKDALHREESCGGHFREEHQTEIQMENFPILKESLLT